jgi:ATP-dependent protease HslVU (ClpYQ) peptidase subunit
VTVIAGIAEQGRVILGGDSAGVAGYDLTVRSDVKVFASGAYLFGFAGSFRAGQLLHWSFQPPEPPSDVTLLDGFMATTWVDALRTALSEGGAAFDCCGTESTGAAFLVGVRGRLLEIDSDFQVGESADGYAAIGCGAGPALGALNATAGLGLTAENRISSALLAAERHSAGVRAPFTIISG